MFMLGRYIVYLGCCVEDQIVIINGTNTELEWSVVEHCHGKYDVVCEVFITLTPLTLRH